MKMPSNIQMELNDLKTNSIVKTKFDELSSVLVLVNFCFWDPYPVKIQQN